MCLPIVDIGSRCSSSYQCRGGSNCQSYVCRCPKNMVPKNGKCASKDDKRVKPSPLPEKRIVVPSITTGRIVTNDVCPHPLRQYLYNGIPRSCLGGKMCPTGYRCTYSKKARGYYCCSSSPIFAQHKSSAMSSLGCPIGSALLYPKTSDPVTCNEDNRCPMGYECMKSTTGSHHYCCSVTTSHTSSTGGSRSTPTSASASASASASKSKMSMSTFKMLQKWNQFSRRKELPMHQESHSSPELSAPEPSFSPEIEEADQRRSPLVPSAGKSKPTLVRSLPCPSYMVLVETEINSRPIKRCRKFSPIRKTYNNFISETSCPSYMTPIGGICRELKK